MVDEHTIERYRKFVDSIDTFLNRLRKQNPVLPSSSLSLLTEHSITLELVQMTGQSPIYFIQSRPDGICFDVDKIKDVRQRITQEIDDWDFFSTRHDEQR